MSTDLKVNHFFKPQGDLPRERFPDDFGEKYVKEWIKRGKQETDRWLTSADYYRDRDDPDGERQRDPHGGYDDPFSGGNYPPHQPFEDARFQTLRERAVVAFVYWKAWDHVYEQMTANPSSVSYGNEYSGSYTQAQIGSYKERRDKWHDHWQDLVTGDASMRDDDGPPQSMTVQTDVRP